MSKKKTIRPIELNTNRDKQEIVDKILNQANNLNTVRRQYQQAGNERRLGDFDEKLRNKLKDFGNVFTETGNLRKSRNMLSQMSVVDLLSISNRIRSVKSGIHGEYSRLEEHEAEHFGATFAGILENIPEELRDIAKEDWLELTAEAIKRLDARSSNSFVSSSAIIIETFLDYHNRDIDSEKRAELEQQLADEMEYAMYRSSLRKSK